VCGNDNGDDGGDDEYGDTDTFDLFEQIILMPFLL